MSTLETHWVPPEGMTRAEWIKKYCPEWGPKSPAQLYAVVALLPVRGVKNADGFFSYVIQKPEAAPDGSDDAVFRVFRSPECEAIDYMPCFDYVNTEGWWYKRTIERENGSTLMQWMHPGNDGRIDCVTTAGDLRQDGKIYKMSDRFPRIIMGMDDAAEDVNDWFKMFSGISYQEFHPEFGQFHTLSDTGSGSIVKTVVRAPHPDEGVTHHYNEEGVLVTTTWGMTESGLHENAGQTLHYEPDGTWLKTTFDPTHAQHGQIYWYLPGHTKAYIERTTYEVGHEKHGTIRFYCTDAQTDVSTETGARSRCCKHIRTEFEVGHRCYGEVRHIKDGMLSHTTYIKDHPKWLSISFFENGVEVRVVFLRDHKNYGEVHHMRDGRVTHFTYLEDDPRSGIIWHLALPNAVPAVQYITFDKGHKWHGQVRKYVGGGCPWILGPSGPRYPVEVKWEEWHLDHGKVLHLKGNTVSHYTFDRGSDCSGKVYTFETPNEKLTELLRLGLACQNDLKNQLSETDQDRRDVKMDRRAADSRAAHFESLNDERLSSNAAWRRFMNACWGELSEEQFARKVLGHTADGMSRGFEFAFAFAGEHVLARAVLPEANPVLPQEKIMGFAQFVTDVGRRIRTRMSAELDERLHPTVATGLPESSPLHYVSTVEATVFNIVVKLWKARVADVKEKARIASLRSAQRSAKLNEEAERQNQVKMELIRKQEEHDRLLREKNEREAADERKRMEERRAARKQAEKDEEARKKQENAQANAKSRLERAELQLQRLLKQIETTNTNTAAGKARTAGKGRHKAQTPAAQTRSLEEQRQHDQWVDPKEKKAREDLFNARQAYLAAEAETRKLHERQAEAKAQRLRQEQRAVEAAHRPPAAPATVGEALAEGVARASLLGQAVSSQS
tara:strand:- start:2482 stop:5181 length:2700 start_codon:yes stop_codon:yes gene_type:complete